MVAICCQVSDESNNQMNCHLPVHYSNFIFMVYVRKIAKRYLHITITLIRFLCGPGYAPPPNLQFPAYRECGSSSGKLKVFFIILT